MTKGGMNAIAVFKICHNKIVFLSNEIQKYRNSNRKLVNKIQEIENHSYYNTNLINVLF